MMRFPFMQALCKLCKPIVTLPDFSQVGSESDVWTPSSHTVL